MATSDAIRVAEIARDDAEREFATAGHRRRTAEQRRSEADRAREVAVQVESAASGRTVATQHRVDVLTHRADRPLRRLLGRMVPRAIAERLDRPLEVARRAHLVAAAAHGDAVTNHIRADAEVRLAARDQHEARTAVDKAGRTLVEYDADLGTLQSLRGKAERLGELTELVGRVDGLRQLAEHALRSFEDGPAGGPVSEQTRLDLAAIRDEAQRGGGLTETLRSEFSRFGDADRATGLSAALETLDDRRTLAFLVAGLTQAQVDLDALKPAALKAYLAESDTLQQVDPRQVVDGMITELRQRRVDASKPAIRALNGRLQARARASRDTAAAAVGSARSGSQARPASTPVSAAVHDTFADPAPPAIDGGPQPAADPIAASSDVSAADGRPQVVYQGRSTSAAVGGELAGALAMRKPIGSRRVRDTPASAHTPDRGVSP